MIANTEDKILIRQLRRDLKRVRAALDDVLRHLQPGLCTGWGYDDDPVWERRRLAKIAKWRKAYDETATQPLEEQIS